ncbi:Uncharacterized protein PECH_002470 [Penicillium ucsense]|uniref:VOC domain-containing protein n=1 Tax=Penicillium ucsense TaxID=2839758 RepID=A0A8J8WJ25_9EURO|nr:Uncharacterized protein PECM_006690 [Penicillium ucsense]KAF7730911.1 Uncharacterized protein PECH_002470 [Penicillium ucsense]
MPVSHLTLTVSHLPTSTSFFLSCLQPLGYQFIGRHDDYIGFGQKQGEPADFWITEKKPGVLPSAAHVAFPAPSKDAVTTFFHSAIQAGGQYHGEPRTRDSQTGYYSAAVIDFDGNSIEAVYRPGAAPSVAASVAGGPTIGLIENGSAASKAGSVVSKANSVASKATTVKSRAISKAPTVVERTVSAPSVVSVKSTGSALAYGAPPPAPQPPAQKVDDGSKAAKTIIGTLIGAAAGAAVAYAMVRGDSESQNAEAKEAVAAPPSLHQYAPDLLQLMAPPSQISEARYQAENGLRAIEAPPARSVYTSASAARSTASRSVMSKNPWASTVYEATEHYQDDKGRRASDGGSVYSIPEDAPLRAIDYPPRSYASQQRYPCNPSTFISSYAADKPRAGSVHSSASTVKTSASHRRHSTDDGFSEHPRAAVCRSTSSPSVHTVKSHAPSKAAGGAEPASDARSLAPSSHSARNIPLPASSSGTFYSAAPSQSGKSTVSARHVPLPASSSANSFYSPAASQAPRSHISARHVLLPESVIDVDVDSNVTPDDSISQVGGSRSGRSTHSHHSKHSKHSKHTHSHGSRHSSRSKMDEPVRPADSVSQVSRSSHRHLKTGGSKVESRRGTEVMV